MVTVDSQNPMAKITQMLTPWLASIQSPQKSQEAVLQKLLTIYAQTEYGGKHGAEQVGSIADYRAKFPIATYERRAGWLDRGLSRQVPHRHL